MVACTHQNTHIVDSTIAEAIDGLQAVTITMELDYRNLDLEGDCSTVIKKINDINNDRSYLSVLTRNQTEILKF